VPKTAGSRDLLGGAAVSTKFQIHHRMLFTGELADFDERTDQLYEALLDLDGFEDADMASNLTEGTVEASMVVDADDEIQALMTALGCLRAAIHAIGDATWGWEALRTVGSHAHRVDDAEGDAALVTA
jgi:hypothetical protein